MQENKFNRRYLLFYTAAFLLISLAVFLPFLTEGKSFVGKGDGLSQYILQLRYMGQWLRQTVRDFLHGDFTLRSYDFTIGMGDDIGSIVRFHPLDYLSVFVPASGTETLYAFLIFLRLYLAGLSFSLYVFHWKCPALSTLAGSIVYLYCGYVFELGIVHPIYISPMIVMPLLLLGAEYMMDPEGRHSFILFSVMVYLGFTSNYYFMYINSVALLIYVLVRFGMIYREKRVKMFFLLFVRMVSAYLVGLMLSAVTLLPTLLRYFNSYRSQSMAQRGNLLFYEDVRRYFAWFINLISPLEASGNGTHLNFAVIVLPCITILVLAGREKWRGLKRLLLANLLFLLLPFGGYIMAVMHTENNRWVYLISLTVGVTVSFACGQIGRLSRLQKTGIVLVTAVFDAAAALLTILYGLNVYHILAAAQLTAAVILILAADRATYRNTSGAEGGRTPLKRAGGLSFAMAVILCITVVSSVLNGYFTFGKPFGDLTRYYAPRGTTESFFSESKYANYNEVGSGIGGEEEGAPREWTEDFYRVDGYWRKSSEDNAAIQLGYPGVQIYNSVLNASQISYLMDTENTGLTTMLHIHTLDGRTASEAVAGVKYYQIQKKYPLHLPYGFDEEAWSDKKMAIFENRYPVHFGFTTDTVISESDYEALDAVQREEVLLSAAVADDETVEKLVGDGGLERTDGLVPTSGIQTAEIMLPSGTEQIERTDSGYRVKEADAALSFAFHRNAGCDTLVELEGLVPDGIGTSLTVGAQGLHKKVTILSDEQTYTLLRKDYLVNLGYSEKDTEENLTVTFRDRGDYRLDAVRIYSVPRSGYAKKIEQLNRFSLQDVKFGKNTVSGTVELDRARYMVFQIPWSSGWTLRVNGESAELLQTDRCYLGAVLDSGRNEISLIYTTPGAGAGRMISLAGLLLLLCGIVLRRFCKCFTRMA